METNHFSGINNLHRLSSPSNRLSLMFPFLHTLTMMLQRATNIMTDASDTALGAVLQQQVDDQWCPIVFFSKRLTPPKTRYSAFDRELLAVYLAIKHFQHFVEGWDFHILMDHKPLTFALKSNHNHSPRQLRHLDFISPTTFVISRALRIMLPMHCQELRPMPYTQISALPLTLLP